MTWWEHPPLAQATAAVESAPQLTFELGRLLSFGPWQWVLLVGVIVLVAAVVITLYRRDTVELGRGVALLLVSLRLAALLGLLWIYLLPQYRVEREQVIPSRVLLLVDTSQSATLADVPGPDGEPMRRIDAAVHLLRDTPLVEKLRQVHRVTVLKYDAKAETVVDLPPYYAQKGSRAGTSAKDAPKQQEPAPDWARLLAAQGRQSRLCGVLREVLTAHHQDPLAGVVILTDGQNNTGEGPDAAVALAKENRVPLWPVGLGSNQPERSLQVADFLVPARAYRGDAYKVTGYVRGFGLGNAPVLVELLQRPASAAREAADVVDSQQLTLPADGEIVPVQFEQSAGSLDEEDEPAGDASEQLLLTLRVRTLSGKPLQAEKEKMIEIVDYKTRVLLLAGGPTREYRFVRNQLKRDPSMVVHVVLQTAQEGVSQDADELLDDFPSLKQELYDYDCIVAFDFNWRELSQQQIEMLQDWVAEEAGGLVVVAGPVYMDTWVRSQTPAMTRLRGMVPVLFQQHFAAVEDDRFQRKEPARLVFTPEGLTAPFLQLADTPEESRMVWETFEGVYGYYRVKGPKPAATVFARFDDPTSTEEETVYLAGHFYGSGRVFYLGSGEMWRLRSQGAGYFEAFWTKLIRHVSQGRLLRGSKRGVLLVQQDTYQVGQTVAVQAQLKNAQLEPLELTQVTLEIVRPDQKLQTLTLAAKADRPGTYAGQFSVYLEGNYQLRLPVPESDEVLTWSIEAVMPDVEKQNAQRNDALLEQLASQTGGSYLDRWQKVLEPEPLWQKLPDRRRTIILRGTPQTLWDNQWTLLVICGLLFAEWLIRRLSKLA